MSSLSAASLSAAFPTLSFHGHGHRKGSPVAPSASTDALTGADSSADASAPATNQGIFSALLQKAEQIVGVQLTSPTATPTAPSASTASAPARSDSAGAPPPALQQIQAQSVPGALNPGLAKTLAKLQLLTNPTQAAASSSAGSRVDTTA